MSVRATKKFANRPQANTQFNYYFYALQIGMVKSPVEGSNAALIRLETPVKFSDFIRPICLPDKFQQKYTNSDDFNMNGEKTAPFSEKLSNNSISQYNKDKFEIKEERQYFIGPEDIQQTKSINVPQEMNENIRIRRGTSTTVVIDPIHMEGLDDTKREQWTTCNTLGWSKQRGHLQRVQLKMSDMATCENISIATVNSMCTEAAFHKNDCTEEEFAGSPVMCLLPDSLHWALVGVTSWRIACAPTGVGRPRMYDKITPNSEWIQKTINLT